ncbi:MAG: homoserine kinase [Epsilonproteobacteria bacterium]|nr:homoserine kinase [Campylobacterota bacterium]
MIIKVPATSANLGPGFDTLGIAIDLHNTIIIKKSNFFSLSIKGEGADRKRFKSNNLFVKIFYEIFERLYGKKEHFRFEFYNKIPISRGLGSSSAVITSAVAAAHYFYDKSCPKETILNDSLAYESHPDNIAPAVLGGFTVSILNDNKVLTQKKEMPNDLKAVVVIPNRPMSTALSRGVLPKHYSIQDAVYNISHSSFLTAAFMDEKWELLKVGAMDRLHQDLRMSNMKELFAVQRTAYENGALLSTLSGSGSTFFNICYENDVKRLLNTLKIKFPAFKVESFSFDNIGLKVKF